MDDSEFYDLNEVEIETVRRAAEIRKASFDPSKTRYTRREINDYGLVREGYSREELQERGITSGVVSSLDVSTDIKMKSLPLGTPFGKGIEKYELPVDMLPLRMAKTIFRPATEVKSHVHPPNALKDPGGGMRVVVSGSIKYDGRTYGPGDWFFVPNGVAYEFETHSTEYTVVFYTYRFFALEKGNRFSHPYAE